eukprot:GDKI01028177.1.p1 GENE.GDKI01028177.1~~GDKI01028177.1.p1  ORF type:complete len:600 (-),score=206.49 GDKI01028177.1:20-1819(-)
MKITLSAVLLLLAAPFTLGDPKPAATEAVSKQDMFMQLLKDSPKLPALLQRFTPGTPSSVATEASELSAGAAAEATPLLGKPLKKKGKGKKKPHKNETDGKKKKENVNDNPLNKPIDHCKGAYDEAGSYRYVRYSHITYCDEFEEIGKWECSLCRNKSVRGLRETVAWLDTDYNNLGMAGYDPTHNEIIVAFRGTQKESINNWLTNVNFLHTEVSEYEFMSRAQEHWMATHGGDNSVEAKRIMFDLDSNVMSVHSGWANQYEDAAGSDLVPHVLDLAEKYPKAKIVCTGHSMGGAMAYMCGLDYKSRMPHREVKVYTYGAPRLFNSAMADFYDSFMGRDSTWRVTNGADLPVQMPPQAEDFQHVGNEVWYVANKRNVCCCGESLQCSGKLPYWRYTIVEHSLYYLDMEFGECRPFNDDYSSKMFDHIDPTYESRVLERARERWGNFEATNFLEAAMVTLTPYVDADEDISDDSDGGDDFYDVDSDNDTPTDESDSGASDGSDDDDDGGWFMSVHMERRLKKEGKLRGTHKDEGDDKDGKPKKNEASAEEEKVHFSYMRYGMFLTKEQIEMAEDEATYGPYSVMGSLAKYALEPSEYCRA